MLLLRPAHRAECAVLTDLCFRSKAAWGYDAAFMEICRDELTLTPKRLERSVAQVAEDDGHLVGFAEIVVEDDIARLEKLFVDPKYFGIGVGRKLFDWAVQAAVARGASLMMIESHPGAAPFYRRMGALDDGVVASGSVHGRTIPSLRLPL